MSIRVQWVLAAVVAPVGSVAYLLVPSAQWWDYGPLIAVPLAALAFGRAERHAAQEGDPAPWYGDMRDVRARRRSAMVPRER